MYVSAMMTGRGVFFAPVGAARRTAKGAPQPNGQVRTRKHSSSMALTPAITMSFHSSRRPRVALIFRAEHRQTPNPGSFSASRSRQGGGGDTPMQYTTGKGGGALMEAAAAGRGTQQSGSILCHVMCWRLPPPKHASATHKHYCNAGATLN